MSKLTIIAHVYAKPNFVDKLKAELLEVIDTTRAEEGCLQYELYQDNVDPTHFMFYENWENHELWQKHMNTDYFKDSMKATEEAIDKFTVNEMTMLK